MMADRRGYTADELAWLEANCTLPTVEYHRQFCERFEREVPADRLRGYRVFRGWKTGRSGFVKGCTSPMKGKPAHPNSNRSRFAKGHKVGAHRHRPIGAELITKEGYRQRKVTSEGPPNLHWKLVHHIEWETVHGPIPSGMVLKCIGDRGDPSPSNFELVPHAILPRLNGLGRHGLVAYDTAPAELKPSILAVARLEYAAARGVAGD